MNRSPFVLGLLVVVASAVAAEVTDRPSLKEPLPFDHALHARTLDRAGLGCVSCHPVGLTAQALPPPPISSCHGCHLGTVRGAGKSAPSECEACHDDRAALRPANHGIDWIEHHGLASRAGAATCSDCHSASACLDCHDRRGAGSTNPHPVGFRQYHGVEARVDPRSCSTCHTEASCTSCHESGVTPW
jgi:hypothetical protein